MRKILSLILLTSGSFAALAQTNYPNGVPGCIARWNFTNSGPITSLPDVSGNNNNGTVYNLAGDNGFRNLTTKAMKFNGTSSYALVASNAMLNPTQITMITVTRFHSFNSNTCQTNEIISKGYPHFISGNWSLGISDNVYDNGNCSTYEPTKFQLNAQFYNGNADPPAGNYIDTGKWYFLACSYDGSTARYYMTEMDTSVYHTSLTPTATVNNINTPIGSNTQDVSIGKHLNPTYPYWVDGEMDELSLFNRVLSDSEIHAVYTYLWGQLTVDVPNTTILCDTVSVNYTVYNPDIFQGNNMFVAQLSNASGSFASPVNIGSVSSVTSGTIACTLPPATPQGTGYRIRVVANNSHFISPDNGTDITIYPVTNMHPSIQQSGMNLSLALNYSTYQWFYNNAPINPGGTNPTYTATQPGAYFVRITNDNGCVGYSDTIHIWPAGVQNTNNTPASIKVYPNPAKNILNLSYSNINDGRIEIMDMTGRILIGKKLASTIDIARLANGVYMYRVYEGDVAIFNGKLVKE